MIITERLSKQTETKGKFVKKTYYRGDGLVSMKQEYRATMGDE